MTHTTATSNQPDCRTCRACRRHRPATDFMAYQWPSGQWGRYCTRCVADKRRADHQRAIKAERARRQAERQSEPELQHCSAEDWNRSRLRTLIDHFPSSVWSRCIPHLWLVPVEGVTDLHQWAADQIWDMQWDRLYEVAGFEPPASPAGRGPCSSLTRTYETWPGKGDTFESRFFLPPPRETPQDFVDHPATYRYPEPMHNAVRAMAATYGLDSHDVEDMEQEAALRLFGRWLSFAGDLDDFDAVALTHVKQASIEWLRNSNHSHELKQWRTWLANYEDRSGISLLDDYERYRIFDAKGARRWYLDAEIKTRILPPEYVHESLSWQDGSDRVDLGSVTDAYSDPIPLATRLAALGWSSRQQRVAVLTALDYTQAEIATSLGVTKRTVARDLRSMRDATFPDFETSSLADLSPGDDGTCDGATDTAGPQA